MAAMCLSLVPDIHFAVDLTDAKCVKVLTITHAYAGVVLCIPYPHADTVNGGPSAMDPSNSASTAEDSYELIAALTRVRGILFGEDFHHFLRGGATQRYSLTTYLDLFCYQPPEHRSAIYTTLLLCNSSSY